MEPKLLVFYDNEINAQDIKTILNDSGIVCILQNEMKTSVNVMSESAEEGVAVYVDKKDYTKSKEILDAYEERLEERLKWCPECGSEDVKVSVVHVKYKPQWAFVAIFGLSLGYDKKVYHCNKCGCDF